MTPVPQERLHGLDAVRALALILGVVLHASMSFMPGAQSFWIIADNHPSATLAGAFYVIHALRMSTFFLIAGLFGHMSFHRLGLSGFVKDRLKRIAVPLLVGWPILLVAIFAVIVWAAYVSHGGALPKESPPGPAFTPSDFPLTHLWFLYVLLLFYVVAVALRSVAARLDGDGRVRAAGDRVVRFLVRQRLPVLLAVPVCLTLASQSKWLMWFGVPTPDHSLYPDLPALTAYGMAFGLGWLIDRQKELLAIWQRRCCLNLLLAVSSTVVSLAIVGVNPVLTPASPTASTYAYATFYSLAIWSWSFALIGLSLRFLSGFSASRRYVADASYWIYLVHLPIVMALQVMLSRLPWPWLLKLPVLLAIAFALMLATYQLLVRHSFIGAVLNGRRKQRGDIASTKTQTVATEAIQSN